MRDRPQPSCPSAVTLSAWLDDERSDAESRMVRAHLEECVACREQVVAWVHVLGGGRPSMAPEPDHDSRARITIPNCPDEELLVAYSEAELSAAEAGLVEQHLQVCARCVNEVRRLIRRRMAMGEEALGIGTQPRPEATAPAVLAPRPGGRGRQDFPRLVTRWVARLAELARSMGRPWPALGAVVAAVALVLVAGRFLPVGKRTGDVQLRGPGGREPRRVAVVADNTVARARPGDDQAVVATLGHGTVANGLEESGEWTRIELPDGRRVWVRSAGVAPVERPIP